MYQYLGEYREHVAKNIVDYFGIDKWVIIANVTHMRLQDFYDLELYEQEAVYLGVVNYLKQQEEQQKKTLNSLSENLQSVKEPSHATYHSPKFQFD